MMIHLHRDLEELKDKLLTMGAMVEQAIDKSIVALDERRSDLAKEVIEGDADIDEWEVQVEELCLRILALHQPVAVDLRFITAVMKTNNDLERMADYAGNIAERTLFLVSRPPIPVPDEMAEITRATKAMVRDSLNAFVNRDSEAARDVILRDDEVDRMNVEIITGLREMMQRDPDTIERAMHLFSASRYLERVADLATNISEDVVYMVEGEIIRHKHGELEADTVGDD